MNKHLNCLGFYQVIEKLKTFAQTEKAKSNFDDMTPILNEDICRRKLLQTTEAREILDKFGNPPISAVDNIKTAVTMAKSGAMLMPNQLFAAARFLAGCKRVCAYLKRGMENNFEISSYCRSFEDLNSLQAEIENAVDEEKVLDNASNQLRDIRRDIAKTQDKIKEKLSHILQSRKQFLADSFIAERGGRYVLPVMRKYQSVFGGTVVEVSNKGTTVFMEPDSVRELSAELSQLKILEELEEQCILYTISAMISDEADKIERNIEITEILDEIFARAKLSADMNATCPEIGCEPKFKIIAARHPMLDRESCVPLDFEMSADTVGIIITGPNTGGKTVSIKTVGLLCAMAQCGLHIPCEKGSYIAMRDKVLCDIGDGQSIEQNLSTFSGHITNVISILEQASRGSLVLLDELGSGTDPAEGVGIAVAVLDELRARGCMFLTTTHYSQVKDYAEETKGILSARMAFDSETLRPLYRLEMGRSGESCALYIAERLGMPAHILKRAHHEVYGGGYDDKARMKAPKNMLVASVLEKTAFDPSTKFSIGDSVIILKTGETGIVYRPADDKGDVVVQVKGKKLLFKHNRIKLQIPAAELYPPDYDFAVIFDSVEHRKARKILSKRHDQSVVLSYMEEEFERGDK